MRAKKKKARVAPADDLKVVPQPRLVLKPEFRTARLTEGEVAHLIKLVGSVWAQLSVTWPVENLAEAHRLLKEAQKRSSRDGKSGQESPGPGGAK